MSRVLFVVPPLVGHVHPTAAVGAVLRDAGHDVAWIGHAEVLRPHLPEGAKVLDVASHLSDVAFADLRSKGAGLRGAAAFRFLFEDLFWPLADAMVPVVDDAVATFRPDVIVADQQALAGPLVARRRDLPWVTSAATSASLVDPLGALPQLRAWMEEGTAALAARHGLPPDVSLLSERAVLVFSTEALVGTGPFPSAWHFVGPVLAERPSVPFPWSRLRDDVPVVLASLGTVSSGRGTRFYEALLEGARDLDVQLVIVAPPDSLPDAPDDAIVQGFVPQLALLPRCAAVVCHAGHNTVVEALWHDLPLVVAPVRDDQPVVAHQVVTAGAGVRVKFGRAKAPRLQRALADVLGEPTFLQAAARVGASFRTAGGATRAAEVVLRAAHRTADG